MIAASYLKAKGFQRVKNVLGGWSKIQTMKLPISRDQRKVEAN
jgi:rhodanese-related sulfurtransferase